MNINGIKIKGFCLKEGEKLMTGEALRAADGDYYAVMQEDGNFVHYDSKNFVSANAVWASDTYKSEFTRPFSIVMQKDGKLAMYDQYNELVWAAVTREKGRPRYSLELMNGELAVKDGNKSILWKSTNDTNLLKVRGNTLKQGEILHEGEALKSTNNQYYAIMQHDGNFVLYKSANFVAVNATWSSKTSRTNYKHPFHILMQSDGNVVMYDNEHRAIWATNTDKEGSPNYYLDLTSGGILVLKDGKKKILWQNTDDEVTKENLRTLAKVVEELT